MLEVVQNAMHICGSPRVVTHSNRQFGFPVSKKHAVIKYLHVSSSGHISHCRKLDRITDLQDSGYTSYFKEICKIAKYGRNARGLAVYVWDDISKRVTEILANMKEILWIGSGRKIVHL
jgi:glucan biosynthesis protein